MIRVEQVFFITCSCGIWQGKVVEGSAGQVEDMAEEHLTESAEDGSYPNCGHTLTVTAGQLISHRW